MTDDKEVIYPQITELHEPAPTVEPPPRQTRKRWNLSKVKKWVWRFTASYIWVRVVFGYFFGWQNEINQLEAGVTHVLLNALDSIGVGFAPINGINITIILKTCWLLIITELNPLEFVGLFLYVILFPLVCISLLVIALSETKVDEVQVREANEVKTARRERLRLSLSGLFLICWLLLYGGANTDRQMILGEILAGVFFILIIYRIFQRSRPLTDISYFRPLLSAASSMANMQKERIKKQYQKQFDMKGDLFIHRWSKRILLRLSLLMRGKKGRARIFLFILARYVFSLIAVALSAIIFWGIVIKSVSPRILPLPLCLHISISHFLPGISTPNSPVDIPLWVTIGTSATAWILFVVYIGPASSLLPTWQDAASAGLFETYKLFRKGLIAHKKEEKVLNSKAKVLPT